VVLAFATVASVACEAEPPPEAAGDADGSRIEVLPPVRAGAIEVSRAVVAQPVLGERAALYFTVSNTDPEPDTIVSVDAADLGSASLHRTDAEDGVSRMRPAGPVEVPGSGRVELRPGGLHTMIEALTETLAAGDTVVVSIRTARAGVLSVSAIVVPYTDLLDLLDPGG
jgi:copper(I)-binding protein